jgi:hypothetical protein
MLSIDEINKLEQEYNIVSKQYNSLLKQYNEVLKVAKYIEVIKKHCEEKLQYCEECHTLDCDNCIYDRYRGYEEILDILNEQQSSNIR